MRLLLSGAAAAMFALAATPASAQYGGNPQDQVEGAPAAPGDEDADEVDDQSAVADFSVGKPGMDEAGPVDGTGVDVDAQADVDADVDVDVDQGNVDVDADAEADVDQGDADTDESGDYDDEDRAAPGGYQTAGWQSDGAQTYCRGTDGATGLVVGGGAGALVGRGIDGGRHRGTGTILGAIAGAVIGSAIERSANQQNCR